MVDYTVEWETYNAAAVGFSATLTVLSNHMVEISDSKNLMAFPLILKT